MLRLFVVRSWLVLLLAGVAGFGAWWFLRAEPSVYEHHLSFVLRPGSVIPDEQIPDAVRGLSQQDAQLVNTVAGALANPRFVAPVASSDPDPLGEGYALQAVVRPGSDIIDATLVGRDPKRLSALADAYRVRAAQWVTTNYSGAYKLEFLGEEPSAGAVGPRVVQNVALAALLGGLLALGVIFAEAKARETRRRAPAAGETGRPEAVLVSVDDLTDRADEIEAALRAQLRDGETIVRIGPRRVGIVPTARTRISNREAQG